jgi:spore germination protein
MRYRKGISLKFIQKFIVVMLVSVVAASMLFPNTGEAYQSGNHLWVMKVTVPKAYVYSQPSFQSSKIELLDQGEEFPIVSRNKYAYKIMLLGGKTGWIEKSKVSVKKVSRVVMGWNAFGSTDTFIQRNSVSPNLNVVSPRWFSLDSERLVSGTVDPMYVQWAHQSGKKVWPLLGNKFDPTLTDLIISNKEKRSKLVSSLKEIIVKSNVDGINVDFENMDIKNKADFVSFVRELREAIEPYGKKVSVDVTRENPDPFWSGCYDRRELGKVADYIILMGYEENWSGGGKAGSVASLPWVYEGTRLLLKDVPAHKVILAVPFYTREWKTNLQTGEVTAIDRSLVEVESLIAAKGLLKKWDKKTYQNYVEYEEKGFKHQIWIEDNKSMSYRRYIVNKFHLSGVAAWYVGMETPDIWTVFNEYR